MGLEGYGAPTASLRSSRVSPAAARAVACPVVNGSLRACRAASRAAFATIFLTGGWSSLVEPGGRPELVRQHLPTPVELDQGRSEILVRLNGAVMVAGGAALALGVKPRLAAMALAVNLVPTTYVGHRFWSVEEPQGKRNQQAHFNKNVSLIGALLTYALTEDR